MATQHYVNNEELYQHIKVRRALNKERIEAGLEKLPLDNYLGKVILDVAKHLAFRPNFINYSYRSDMISDAIENTVRVIDNFDPEKSKHPFAYMTTVMWQAFVRRIQVEQKQQRIKGKIIQEALTHDLFTVQEGDDDFEQKTNFIEYLKDNNFLHDTWMLDDKKDDKEKTGPLDVFMDDVDLEVVDKDE